MFRYTLMLCAALLLTLVAGLIPALTQDKDQPKDPKEEDPTEAWMKLGQPGPQHKWLAEAAGEWLVEGKMWFDPAKDPVPYKGTSKIKLAWDRYLHEEFSGEAVEGMPAMQGFGMMGYDNSNKEFQMIWTSNFETSLHVLSGVMDEKTQSIAFKGEWVEAGMNNMKVKTRIVSRRVSKDEMVIEVYGAYGDGAPEAKAVELTYKRKK